MSTLYLHIGHSKTGSSWLQSIFRLNRAMLLEHGIDYVPGDDAHAEPLMPTSGNGKGLLTSEASFENCLANARRNSDCSLLFSSELLFYEINRLPEIGFIEKSAARFGCDRIKILLYIRDPIDDAASFWQQVIKRSGATESVAAFFAKYDRPRLIAELLDRLNTSSSAEIRVRNYSRVADRITEETAAWLGIPMDSLRQPEKHVNRSCTLAELALQTEFNRHLGVSAKLVSDPLCLRLPDIEPSDVYPPKAVQEEMLARLGPAIDRVNVHLPEAQRYRCEIRQCDRDKDELAFSQDQIAVIADAIANEILELRTALADPARTFGARTLLLASVRRIYYRLARR